MKLRPLVFYYKVSQSIIQGLTGKLSLVFPGGSDGKSVCLQWRETWTRSLGREDPLEKEMATPSSTLAWKIPWTEEPCKL